MVKSTIMDWLLKNGVDKESMYVFTNNGPINLSTPFKPIRGFSLPSFIIKDNTNIYIPKLIEKGWGLEVIKLP